jgi:4-carboxymuconolactone decarboxylase
MTKPTIAAVAEHMAPGLPDAPDRTEPYRTLLGFVPPRIATRFALTGRLDPTSVELQEAIRDHALAPACFDDKTTQLLVFAMLVMELSDAAVTHAIAARRCGASWEELQAIVSLCFLFRGLPAANRGASMLAEAAQHEMEAG